MHLFFSICRFESTQPHTSKLTCNVIFSVFVRTKSLPFCFPLHIPGSAVAFLITVISTYSKHGFDDNRLIALPFHLLIPSAIYWNPFDAYVWVYINLSLTYLLWYLCDREPLEGSVSEQERGRLMAVEGGPWPHRYQLSSSATVCPHNLTGVTHQQRSAGLSHLTCFLWCSCSPLSPYLLARSPSRLPPLFETGTCRRYLRTSVWWKGAWLSDNGIPLLTRPSLTAHLSDCLQAPLPT